MLCPQCKTIVPDGTGRCNSCGCAIGSSGIGGLLSEHPILSIVGLLGCGMMLMYLLPGSKPPAQQPPPPPPPAPAVQTIEPDPEEEGEYASDSVSEDIAQGGESEEPAVPTYESAEPGKPIVFGDPRDMYFPPGEAPQGGRFWMDNMEMYAAAHQINQSELSNDTFKNMVASVGFFIVMGVAITIIRRKLND